MTYLTFLTFMFLLCHLQLPSTLTSPSPIQAWQTKQRGTCTHTRRRNCLRNLLFERGPGRSSPSIGSSWGQFRPCLGPPTGIPLQWHGAFDLPTTTPQSDIKLLPMVASSDSLYKPNCNTGRSNNVPATTVTRTHPCACIDQYAHSVSTSNYPESHQYHVVPEQGRRWDCLL